MEIFNQSKVTITPDMASEMLQRNKKNRPASKPYITFLSDQIKGGYWQYNGQPIIFGVSGNLLDGQHRLFACVQAGIPIVADIKINVPDESFTTIDDRKGRSNADVFYIEDIPNAKLVSSIIARIRALSRGNLIRSSGMPDVRRRHLVSRAELLSYYNQHKDILNEVVLLSKRCYRKRKVLTESIIGAYAAHLIIDKGWDMQTVESFFFQILGDDTRCVLVRTLAKKLLDDALSQRKMSTLLKQAYIIKAFNSFVSGKQSKILKYQPDQEEMPEFLANNQSTSYARNCLHTRPSAGSPR